MPHQPGLLAASGFFPDRNPPVRSRTPIASALTVRSRRKTALGEATRIPASGSFPPSSGSFWNTLAHSLADPPPERRFLFRPASPKIANEPGKVIGTDEADFPRKGHDLTASGERRIIVSAAFRRWRPGTVSS